LSVAPECALAASVLFTFSSLAGWSGTSLLESYFASMWNVLFTAVPIFLIGAADYDVPDEWALAVPALYAPGRTGAAFAPYVAAVVPLVLRGLADPDPGLARNAAFAVGRLLADVTAAARPYCCCSNSKPIFWPSLSPVMPARSTALICTKTSLEPSSGWMNP
jgi:hypothetical protein